jgi:hypothetical protein
MRLTGIYGYLNHSIQRLGWEIHLRKYERDGKVYKAKVHIEWIESSEYESTGEPLMIDHVENFHPVDQESKLSGKSEAQKDEILFLRGELSKAMAR